MKYAEGYAKVFVDSTKSREAISKNDLLEGKASLDKVVQDISKDGWYIALDTREYSIMRHLENDPEKSKQVLAEILGEYGRYAWNVYMVYMPLCVHPDSPIKGSFSGKPVSAKFDT